MLRTRVIPALLLHEGGLVKTVKFSKPTYIGDPINAVRIFNEKEVDELILMDISASRAGREPDYDLIQDIVSEAFMPIAYGGGVRDTAQARRLVSLGIEKISFNSAAIDDLDVVRATAAELGASSTLVSIDVSRDWRGRYRVYDPRSRSHLKIDLMAYLADIVAAGAGEIFINNVTRDGTGKGYDLSLTALVCNAVNLPVIVCGGAGKLDHFREAADAKAAAVAAGSLFVYLGPHRAVMINYPPQNELKAVFHNA